MTVLRIFGLNSQKLLSLSEADFFLGPYEKSALGNFPWEKLPSRSETPRPSMVDGLKPGQRKADEKRETNVMGT